MEKPKFKNYFGIKPASMKPRIDVRGRFTTYLTIYRTNVFSLSSDRLTIVTYNVLGFLLGKSYKLIYGHYL